MLDNTREKIRALVEDFQTSDFETFTYVNSSIFTLQEAHITEITIVLRNGNELGSGEYDYDTTTNKIEILVSLSEGDIIEVDYIFYKYSDNELNEYIRASLVWLNVFDYGEENYELGETDITPEPDSQTLDLIALVSSILIKPDYTTYRLPTMTVIYSGRIPKEQKIQKLVSRFKRGLGVNDVLEFYL